MAGLLDKRLGAIAEAIGEAGIIADIGTDHGLLPISLLLENKAERAIAADIGTGPLDAARRNAGHYGLLSRMEFVLTDGFHGLDKYAPDTVVIAGMGGELIAKIISEAPYLFGGARLFLQPMTKAEALREYLCSSGFEIKREILVSEGKLYQIICAEFSGKREEYAPFELYTGKIGNNKNIPLLIESMKNTEKRLREKQAGLLLSASDTEEERKALGDIISALEENRKILEDSLD